MNILLQKSLGLFLLIAALSACTVAGRPIETPSGPVNSVNGAMNILKIVRHSVTTGNQPNASAGVITQRFNISCPSGTVSAIPVPEQSLYGYGEITPDDLSMMDARGTITATWSRAEQRPLGMVYTGVHVTDINAPDAAGSQRVEIEAKALLTDNNSDDRWWHVQTFHVLCIGNAT